MGNARLGGDIHFASAAHDLGALGRYHALVGSSDAYVCGSCFGGYEFSAGSGKKGTPKWFLPFVLGCRYFPGPELGEAQNLAELIFGRDFSDPRPNWQHLVRLVTICRLEWTRLPHGSSCFSSRGDRHGDGSLVASFPPS